ncbi:UDP-N-acetylglucosamine 4,6-dehydratase (inverting) [Candidatus Microgenomates bacterium]|nr:MAG: UDP-N-acetylglucosamine 4,6-dehydratase (inverting) [Candidatus Microgenomates bacterium]
MFSWSKQVILLTGGTGSFGQAFTQILLKKHPPKILRIFSRDEYKQFLMQQEFKHPSLRYFIGDVRDANRLKRAMDGVTLVVHTAAMKQIVAAEYNPTEAVNTNINGTINILNAGIDAQVERVFGLITDKAVSPINLYGATKLCMEKILIQGNAYTGGKKTKISCARYGNVAGSRGSIIPLFYEQRKNGKITITHKDMTRFWITLEQAVDFVMKAIEQMEGGEVFIPKMPSFRVIDLAKAIAPKAKPVFVGIRPGEKKNEDLVTIHESHNLYEYPKYYILYPEFEFSRRNKQLKRKGKKVKEGFYYNSFMNNQILNHAKLKSLVKQYKHLQ